MHIQTKRFGATGGTLIKEGTNRESKNGREMFDVKYEKNKEDEKIDIVAPWDQLAEKISIAWSQLFI